jgi:molecular chaperone GrpE (heat shock protein)
MTDGNTDERFVDKRAAARMSDETPVGDEANATPVAEPPTPPDELADAKEKADTYYKNWQRAAADFANYKRRIEQERGESARLASAALVINLLPVYDDLDRAVGSVDAQLAGLNWVQGVTAIHQKFGRLLEAMGVKELLAESEPFDPSRHEAVGKQPGEEGKVLHVLQKGYELQGKVIRPAMVIVGDGG